MGSGHLLGVVKLAGAGVASGTQRLGPGGVAQQSGCRFGQVSRVAGPVGHPYGLPQTAAE